jgi:hypothetical protein
MKDKLELLIDLNVFNLIIEDIIMGNLNSAHVVTVYKSSRKKDQQSTPISFITITTKFINL